MYKFLTAVFFIACANICTAQIAHDFEFIDHKVRTATHGASIIVGEELVYVSHNRDSWPMTSVIKVNTINNTVDTLLTTYSSTSSLQAFDDGSFQIFINNLFDYDVGLPGFYSIEYDGVDYNVESFFTYENGAGSDNYYYANDVAKSESGDYYFPGWDFMFRLKPDGTVDTLFESSYNYKLHQNEDKKIYVIDEESIYELTDTVELVAEFFERIIDVENNGQHNDVLLQGELQRWNIDFSERLYTWDLPTEINSFYQLAIEDLNVKGLISNGNSFYVKEFDLNGEGPIVYENEFENQGINGFHLWEENKYLLIGVDSIEEVDYNTLFFRNIDLNGEIEYQSRDVSIDSFVLYQYDSETNFEYVDFQTGDSVFWNYTYTDMTFTFSNQSDSIINVVDARSNFKLDSWYYSNDDFSVQDMQLMPGASYTMRDSLVRFQAASDDVIFAIPGADFRFNHDPNRIAYPDFSSDFDNVSFDLDLKLFPNPTSDLLHIDIDEEIMSLEIYNALGQLVIYKSYGAELNKVDVSMIEEGSYFVRLRLKGQKGFSFQQFVKL